MGVLKHSLAVSSKVSLRISDNLSQQAYALGKQITALGYTALTPINLNLTHCVAQGVSDKSGLSIGFSPGINLRQHVTDLQLPTDIYDWIYFTGLSESALLNQLIRSSQGLLLVGGVMENLGELALALESYLPAGILLDEAEESNNDLLRYLHTLPMEKQRRIVVHQDPKILCTTIKQIIDQTYQDFGEKLLENNNQLFNTLLQDAIKQSKTSS